MSDPYCNFYVGQRVMLRNDIGPANGGTFPYNGVLITVPKSGVVYTVRNMELDGILQRVGIRLVEIVNPPALWQDGFKENLWWHAYFRPVTDISELEKLLTSIPTKELEPV